MVHKPPLLAALGISGKFTALYADIVTALVFCFYPYNIKGFYHRSRKTSKVQVKGRAVIYYKGKIKIA